MLSSIVIRPTIRSWRCPRTDGGRKPLPPELLCVRIEHEKQCGCGCQLTRIGGEISEQLGIILEQVRVLRRVRPQYACKG